MRRFALAHNRGNAIRIECKTLTLCPECNTPLEGKAATCRTCGSSKIKEVEILWMSVVPTIPYEMNTHYVN